MKNSELVFLLRDARDSPKECKGFSDPDANL